MIPTREAKVGETIYETPSDLELAMIRAFDAPRELLWEAWTSSEHLPRWLLGPEGWTMPVCESDLRVGGAWRFVWRHADGSEMGMTGEYREITRPERLVSTQSWGDDWPETLNTLVFVEDGERTIVTQTILYPSVEARDAAIATGMQQGIDSGFDRLDDYLKAIR
jgi:uncharacterized protein YndB with AHSA1/START domain